MAAAQRSRPAVPGLVWELRLAAVGGSLTVLGIVACMVMAGRYGFSLIVYLLLGAGHASACWYLASRARPRGRARAVPGWARSSFAHVLGVLLLLLGFTGAIITGLLILAFFSFFVLGDNP